MDAKNINSQKALEVRASRIEKHLKGNLFCSSSAI